MTLTETSVGLGLVVIFLVLNSPVVTGWVSNGYSLAAMNELPDGSGMEAILVPIAAGNYYGKDIPFLSVAARYETDDRLHVRITDANNSRWEIPQSLLPRPTGSDPLAPLSSKSLNFSCTSEPFGFAITRISTGQVLFNSTPDANNLFGPMVFKDMYLEISTQLPQDATLFGLGESTRPDGLSLAPGRTYTLWNMDVAASNINVDLYGSYPYYMDVREGGSTHSVLLLNSNGMDVYYNGQFVTFKPVGGVLDFYFLAGPTPANVLDQYTQLVGRPAPMPYWSLGFHQCRWGYKDVAELQAVVGNYTAVNIPLEAIWSDIDHMDSYKDFTLDPVNYPEDQLQPFLEQLHASGRRYVIIVDPGIHLDDKYDTFTRGMEADIFIKDTSGNPFLAQVWPGAVYFPDFLHPKIQDYWTNEISEFRKVSAFDGLWIDMNEVSNFCNGTACTVAERPNGTEFTTCFLSCSDSSNSYWDNPPYWIQVDDVPVPLRTKTLGMDATHAGGEVEYNVHNLYGFTESVATNKALVSVLNKRPFVLSRSTFVGSGSYTAHWTGDNAATWDDLVYSVVSVLNSGLFGVPMVGADICGFQFNTTEELCGRWIELGAFYPFSRNHADIHANRHELYLWDSVTSIAQTVLGMRYRLLPFFYTRVYEAHTTGAPIARPLFYEFPQDPAALKVNFQYLLGKSLLVSPVLFEGATTVDAYFPVGTWYNIFNFSQVYTVASGTSITLDAPFETMNVHIAGGSIVPMQEAALTTEEVRNSLYTLLVAFASSDPCLASGELFLDDGERVDMTLEAGSSTFVSFQANKSDTDGSVSSQVTSGEFAKQEGWILDAIVLLGLSAAPPSVSIDGMPAPSTVTITQDPISKAVQISKLNLPVGQSFTLSWSITESSHPVMLL